MKNKITFLMIWLIMFCVPFEANASVGSFLNKLGTLYRTNLGASTYVMSNGSDYATLGSMSLRSPSLGNPLAGLFNVTLPSFHAGCNGLDLNTGGLFFITDPKILVQRLTSYGTSVVYGMLISLSSSLPIIGDALKWLRKQQTDLDGSMMNGCQLGMAIGSSIGTKINAWYDSTQQKKDTSAGASADSAVHHNKTAPVATAFNLAALVMGGYSYETLDLIMSLTGTLIKRPGIQQGSEHSSPLGSTITVKDFMKGDLKNKRQWICQGPGITMSTPVPEWDGTKPGVPAPCINVVKRATVANLNVQQKFSDLIMAAVFHLRFSSSYLSGAVVAGGGVTVGSLMHGYTIAELNAAINGSGSAFAGELQLIASQYDIRNLTEYVMVRNKYADPFAPYMAISYLRGVTTKLYTATIGAPSQYASQFPKAALSEYRKSIEAVARAAYKYKAEINKDYEVTALFVKEADRMRKRINKDSFQNMKVGSGN